MKRRFIAKAFVTAVLIMLLAALCSVGAYAASSASDFVFSNGTITGYVGEGGDVVIPKTIGGKVVKKIGKNAFENCRNITSITIPESVTSIGYDAFYKCDNLESVYISDLAAWCNIAFYNSDSNPLYTGAALYINKVLATEITIPNGVKSIGDYAFYQYESLTSITIPDSVTSIGDDAFYRCSDLESVYISDLAAWCNIAFYDSSSNPLHTGAALYINKVLATEITIPNGVKSIGDYVFCNCDSFTSITIPESVTSIGNRAFYQCKSLTSITIPDGVTSIGAYAFFYCSNLTSITIPGSVTRIGYWAFYGCLNIDAVYISDIAAWCNIRFESDHREALYYAESNPLRAGNGAALYIDNELATEIIIPDGVTHIRDYVFICCDTLTSITIPESVTSIGDCAFENCSNLTSITIPESVTSIGDYVFYNCDSLTSITIPDSVTSIGDDAFYGCSSLTSITIPNSVTSIGDYAFCRCYSLTSITIPDSVTSIADEAFSNCNATLHVYKDTAAHTYAVENGMDFVLLDGATPSAFPEDVTTVLGILSGAKSAPSDISRLDFNSDGRITVYDLNKIISLIRAAVEAE